MQDVRTTNLRNRLPSFLGNEDEILTVVLLPLLRSLRALHSQHIGHHHLSPSHIFVSMKSQAKVFTTPPSPLAAPEELNEILTDMWPDEYLPPDMWVRYLT